MTSNPAIGSPAGIFRCEAEGETPSVLAAELGPGTSARRATRRGSRAIRFGPLAAILAASCAACGAAAADPSPLAFPLVCRFQTVSVGQFHGLDYGPGVPSGSSTLILAASPDDVRDRRAVIIERDGTSVARIVPSNRQTLFVAFDADGGSLVLSVFQTGDGRGLAASLSRNRLIGSIALLVQGAGSCRPGPA